MLVDLQTSSIFSPSPPFFFFLFFLSPVPFLFWPCVSLQKAHSTKERSRPETLNPITIDQSALRGEKCAHLHTRTHAIHTQIRRDAASPVRSGTVICSQLIFNTNHSGLFKKRGKRKRENSCQHFSKLRYFYCLHPVVQKQPKSLFMTSVGKRKAATNCGNLNKSTDTVMHTTLHPFRFGKTREEENWDNDGKLVATN